MRFVYQQGDPNVQAKIIAKIRHVAKFRYEDLGRPLVDTLRGPVKELVVDPQVRILFSCLREEAVMVMLEATRKKNGRVDETVVARACRNHEEWLDTRRSAELDKVVKAIGIER